MNTPCMYCYATADRCAAEDPHGFVCNRLNGHDGDHAACDGDDHPISTWPQRGETTGEALARLQAELTRLLDEADAELRDEADGGVAAALIEKEVENVDPSVDYHAMWWKAEREREKAERERDEARATKDMHKRRADEERARAEKAEKERDEMRDAWEGAIEAVKEADALINSLRAAESRPLTPDAITDEMVERARAEAGAWGHQVSDVGMRHILTAALTEPPARPEGAEDIDEHLRQANAAALGGALTLEQRRALADHLAGFGYRNPIALTEVGLTEKED